jgi:hypothetical protein
MLLAIDHNVVGQNVNFRFGTRVGHLRDNVAVDMNEKFYKILFENY